MKFPSIEQYGEAMQFPKTTILDPKLRTGRVQTDSLGLPWGRSGAFALTFKISLQGASYAFRCFQSQRDSMHERYESISKFLSKNRVGGFVNFHYLDEGIKIQKASYPAVIMDWALGQSLGSYIEDNLDDQSKLTDLQKNLEKLAIDLEDADIAHGDIQSQNILVDTTGHLALVDYDGMFVPTMVNLKAIESGHRNFQHPQREKILPFDATLDRFPFALLHTSIAALIDNPELWGEFKCHPEKILFSSDDLQNPATSKIFIRLAQNPNLKNLSAQIAIFAQARYDQTPKFTEYLQGKQPQISEAMSQNAGKTSQPWYMNPDAPLQDEPTFRDGDSHKVIDARKADEVVKYAGQSVLLVGKIIGVDVGKSSKGIPHVLLTLLSSNSLRVEVAIWAEGLKSFANAGTTVDASWLYAWITADGELSSKTGSSTGPYVRLTIDNSEQLDRISHQKATHILKKTGEVLETGNVAKTETNSRNEVLISTLGGNKTGNEIYAGSISISKQASSSSGAGNSNQASKPIKDSFLSNWGLVIAMLVLPFVFVGIFILASNQGSGFGSSEQEGESVQEAPDLAIEGDAEFTRFYAEYSSKCLAEDRSVVACIDATAIWRVVEVRRPNEACSPSMDSEKLTTIVKSAGVLCTNLVDLRLESAPLITCISTMFDDGPYVDCFPGEGWEYLACFEWGQNAVLQQNIRGSWETVKTNIAVDNNCNYGIPWTVQFSRKASGFGEKQYRVLIPAGGGFDLQIKPIEVIVEAA